MSQRQESQTTFDYTLTLNDLAVLAHLRAHIRQRNHHLPLKLQHDTFSADDFRNWGLHEELENKDFQHSIGDWFRKAKAQGEIEPCNWVTSTEPSNNRRKIRLYRIVKK